MYQFSYAEILDDSGQDGRAHERQLLGQAIEMLEAAETSGIGSPEAVKALVFLQKLWIALLEDLAHEDNALPEKLRGSLISIGIWMLKEADKLRAGTGDSLKPLIDINLIIRDGLR